jgi:hypothetical protein
MRSISSKRTSCSHWSYNFVVRLSEALHHLQGSSVLQVRRDARRLEGVHGVKPTIAASFDSRFRKLAIDPRHSAGSEFAPFAQRGWE